VKLRLDTPTSGAGDAVNGVMRFSDPDGKAVVGSYTAVLVREDGAGECDQGTFRWRVVERDGAYLAEFPLEPAAAASLR
jgi:hypothetical protein